MPPAPLPVLPGVYYARVEATSDLRSITNILAFKKAGLVLNDPADTANAQAVALSLSTRWSDLSTFLHTTYNAFQASVYALGSVLVPPQTSPMSVAGLDTGATHFDQVAGRVKHQVTRRGRGSQHSSFLSPISINRITVNGDQVTTAWVDGVTANWNAMINEILTDVAVVSPGTWTYVQVSKFQNKVLTPNTFHILGSTAVPQISSQRRRLGRG
jgi:hypothetical protein